MCALRRPDPSDEMVWCKDELAQLGSGEDPRMTNCWAQPGGPERNRTPSVYDVEVG